MIIILTAGDLTYIAGTHIVSEFMVWALALILLGGLAKMWGVTMVSAPLDQLWNKLMSVGPQGKKDAVEDEKTED